MCVKNSMPYIMASINSFNNQTYKKKELIIIYSKSNDQTIKYLNNINNKSIKILKYEGSIYESLNYGFKHSSGNLIGILHSDDVFFDNEILKNIASNYKISKSDLIYGNVLFSARHNLIDIKRIWKQNKIINKYDLPPHTGTFISKKILKKFKYDNNYLISSDTDLLIKIFKQKKIKFMYLNKYISIMREGGISTKLSYIYIKITEDLKIFFSHGLSLTAYVRKILSKFDQFLIFKKIKFNSSLLKLNSDAKCKFYNFEYFTKYESKIISALNLAFIAYDYKYKIRRHNTIFWPDGLMSEISTNKKKMPGRNFLKKFIKSLNNNPKIFRRVYVYGNLPELSTKWLSENLNSKFIHSDLPYGDSTVIKRFIKRKRIFPNSIIILTLPTPKQEIIANYINDKNPTCTILCIGGSINMCSNYEQEAPKIFYDLNLEWLWRLKFDTKRRFKRLIETFILYLISKLTGKNKIF